MHNQEKDRVHESEGCRAQEWGTGRLRNPDIYRKLSAEQRRAVTHGEGPMLVTAGPGSGKTHVLTSRILYLIQERQIPPDQILVITFTREAARAMQQRFYEMTEKFRISADSSADVSPGMSADVSPGMSADVSPGMSADVLPGMSADVSPGISADVSPGISADVSPEISAYAQYEQVSFGTFHSFFYQILRSSERYTQYRIIGETEKQKLLYPVLKEIRERGEEAVSPYYEAASQEEISRILSAISYGKNTGRGLQAGEQLQEPWREAYREILQGYERQKAQRRQLDLDDLLTLTARELERDQGLLQYWRSRYRYVLMDEFQDCNLVQYEIMKKLFTTEGNVFAVGDDDQAIYGFRGADPGIMQRFLEEYLSAAPASSAIRASTPPRSCAKASSGSSVGASSKGSAGVSSECCAKASSGGSAGASSKGSAGVSSECCAKASSGDCASASSGNCAGVLSENHAGASSECHAGIRSHVVLGRNYRCSPAVVDASARVIACNRHRMPKQLASARESGGSVQVRGFASGRKERDYVLSLCQGKTIRELNGWAALFRTNGLLGVFAAELTQAQIPFVTRDVVKNIYDHFVVRDVMDYFRAAYGCRERKVFLRIWNRPRLRIGREALPEPAVDFESIRRFYSGAPYENPDAVRDVEQFERKLGQLRRFSLELGITFIRRGFGYEDYLRQRAGQNRELLESWLEILDWLEEDCREYPDFARWESGQERASRKLAQQTFRGKQKKGIHVLTMHAAKGLEYDRVFLMDVNEGNIPKLKKGAPTTEEMLEEERRLLYVGMTRARDSLELLYLAGTRQRPRQPSAFLQPLLASGRGGENQSSSAVSSSNS